MRAVAAVFIALEALAAFWLAAVARHGPAGLAWAALIYLAAAAAITWWAAGRLSARPRAQGISLLGTAGVILLGLAPATLFVMDAIESSSREARIAATRVSEVRDQPIVSAAGRWFGVRLSFDVQLPSAGQFGIFPMLQSSDPADQGLALSANNWTIDGRPGAGKIAAGRHRFEFELYPAILSRSLKGEFCLSPVASPTLRASGAPAPLRLEINETPYGATWRGGREERTRTAYSVVELYRGVLSQGFQRCRDGATSG